MAHEAEADSLTRTAPKHHRIYTTLAGYREQRPGSPHSTHWLNPTEAPMRAPIWVGPRADLDPRSRREMIRWSGFYTVEIKPGEVVELPSEWDEAIQTVRGGRIVAGLMPRARRVAAPGSGEDPPAPELHPSLDDQRAAPARRRRKAGA